jgi:hypothetical protein
MYWEIKLPQGYDVNCRGSPGLPSYVVHTCTILSCRDGRKYMTIFNAKSNYRKQVSNVASRMTSEFAIRFVCLRPQTTQPNNLQNMIIGQELVTGQCSILTICYFPASSSN